MLNTLLHITGVWQHPPTNNTVVITSEQVQNMFFSNNLFLQCVADTHRKKFLNTTF